MKIEVIGRGNVGSQFARIFGVTPVPPRSLDGLSRDADLYIIAVSDSAVSSVAESMPQVKGVVVHTTGSVPMDVLASVRCKGYGVLYPFQSISKSRPLRASDIPLLIEACDGATLEFIATAAGNFGFKQVKPADSEMRRRVHLTGIFANNFTNAMIGISQKLLSECGLDPDIVTPLIAETFEKIKTIPAKEAQTGPAARNDQATIEKHLQMLESLGMRQEADIYRLISTYITDTTR